MKTGLAYKGTLAELAKLGYDASHLKDEWPHNYERIGDVVYQRRDDLEGDKYPLRTCECLIGTLEEIQTHVFEKYDAYPSCTLEDQFNHYREENLDSFFGMIFYRQSPVGFGKLNFYVEK
jgi:hypothetical protein